MKEISADGQQRHQQKQAPATAGTQPTERIAATVGTPAKAEKPVTAGTLATVTAWSIARVGTQATAETPAKEKQQQKKPASAEALEIAGTPAS